MLKRVLAYFKNFWHNASAMVNGERVASKKASETSALDNVWTCRRRHATFVHWDFNADASTRTRKSIMEYVVNMKIGKRSMYRRKPWRGASGNLRFNTRYIMQPLYLCVYVRVCVYACIHVLRWCFNLNIEIFQRRRITWVCLVPQQMR